MSKMIPIDADDQVKPVFVVPSDRDPATETAKVQLGQRLVGAGLIREDQLETALEHQRAEEDRLRALSQQQGTASQGRTKRIHFKRLGEIVAELGLVDEADLLPLLGEQLGVEGVRLREGLIDPNAVRLIPRDYAERLKVLPLMRIRDELTVAMADPQDLAAIDTISRLSGCRIRPVFTLVAGIERLLPRCYEEDFTVDSVTAGPGRRTAGTGSRYDRPGSARHAAVGRRQSGYQLGELRHHSSGSPGRKRYPHRSRPEIHFNPFSNRRLTSRSHETAQRHARRNRLACQSDGQT